MIEAFSSRSSLTLVQRITGKLLKNLFVFSCVFFLAKFNVNYLIFKICNFRQGIIKTQPWKMFITMKIGPSIYLLFTLWLIKRDCSQKVRAKVYSRFGFWVHSSNFQNVLLKPCVNAILNDDQIKTLIQNYPDHMTQDIRDSPYISYKHYNLFENNYQNKNLMDHISSCNFLFKCKTITYIWKERL